MVGGDGWLVMMAVVVVVVAAVVVVVVVVAVVVGGGCGCDGWNIMVLMLVGDGWNQFL